MNFHVGDRVSVNDPKWYKHGAVGTVVKVNKVTLRVRLDGEPTDVVGAHQYFEKA
jgi:hypothetical protein